MKEVSLVKRFIMVLAVMALMAAILAMTASAGFAAIKCQKSTGDISSCQGGSGSGYDGGGGGSGGGGQLTFDYSNPDNPAFTQKGGSGGGSRGGDGGGSGSNCSGTVFGGDTICTGRNG
jgi:hypothetical protein